MLRHLRRRACALAFSLAAVAAFVVVPAAGAVVFHAKSGRFIGLVPRHGVSPAMISGLQLAAQPHHAAGAGAGAAANTTASTAATTTSGSSSGNLDYHGGTVLHSSTPYLVFWDPQGHISAASRALLARYMTDAAADSGHGTNVFAVDRQFTDTTGLADYSQTFTSAQTIADAQPFPARDTTNCTAVAATYPTCLTDSQILAELQRLQSANGLASATPTGGPVYIVVTPPDANVCSDASNCASSSFCAYHSSYGSASSVLLYVVAPMFFSGASAAQNPKFCQSDGISGVQEPNGDIADVAIKYLSHELNETITDPTGTGWYSTATGNENGDNCNYTGSANPAGGSSPNAFGPVLGGSAAAGTLYDQLVNGHPYYTQTEWSNAAGGCEAQPAAATLTPALASVSGAGAGQTITFDPSATASSLGYTSVTWNFGDGSAPTFGAGAPAAVSHAFSHTGTYTVSMTVVDGDGNAATASRQVIVSATAVASFTVNPAAPTTAQAATFDGTGSFTPGAQVTAYAWSFGDGTAGGTGPTPTHTYAAAGTYTVSLTITDSAGHHATTSRLVTVSVPPPPAPTPLPVVTTPVPTTLPVTLPSPSPLPAPPVVHLLPSATIVAHAQAVRSGWRVNFDGSRSKADGSRILAWHWSFGDGAAATGAKAVHVFRRGGTYTVTLTVTDASGATSKGTWRLRLMAARAHTARAKAAHARGRKTTRRRAAKPARAGKRS